MYESITDKKGSGTYDAGALFVAAMVPDCVLFVGGKFYIMGLPGVRDQRLQEPVKEFII